MVESDGNSFHPNSPKKQASDWLAPQEANVNNNNSLEAPNQRPAFCRKIGGKKLPSPCTTPNLKSHSASTEKIKNGPL